MSLIFTYKKKLLFALGLCLIAITATIALNFYTDYKKEITRWHSLRDAIIAQTKGFKGTAHIVIKDYNRNWSISINSDTKIPAASIIKIPIMAAVFRAQEEGRLSVSDKIKLKQKDKTSGSGTLKNERSGKEFSIQQLVELMMTISEQIF